jgi:hypothetical protein
MAVMEDGQIHARHDNKARFSFFFNKLFNNALIIQTV